MEDVSNKSPNLNIYFGLALIALSVLGISFMKEVAEWIATCMGNSPFLLFLGAVGVYLTSMIVFGLAGVTKVFQK